LRLHCPMTKRTYEKKMRLDMPFGEALEGFARTDPEEMHANIARAKKKKPPGGKKAPSGDKVKDPKVVSLRAKRQRKRYG
jgi:hypothetical protein